MTDEYGRNITYLRLSVTDLCNLRCLYCMPEKGIPQLSHEKILRVEECVEIARAAISLGIHKIRITGGEPLIRRGILDAGSPQLGFIILTGYAHGHRGVNVEVLIEVV